MRLRKVSGCTPIQTIGTMRASITSLSRSERSIRLRFSACSTGPNITRRYIHSM
jgi:hypothetical protein